MKRLLLALFLPSIAFAQQPQEDAAMVRMRDAMKKLTQRIVEAESNMAAAQAAQFAAEAASKELAAKLEAANKQIKSLTSDLAAEKSDAEKKITDLERKAVEDGRQIAGLTDALGKWKEGFEKAKTIAETKEGERAEAAARSIELERKASAHEKKNREMYALGMEILERYKKFGLGTALLSREPFVGSMRVKFQNYIQDYGNKLEAQRIDPTAPVTSTDPAAVQAPAATASAEPPASQQ